MSNRSYPGRNHRARTDSGPDDGFTLIELLLVTLIIPIIVGALVAGLLSVFSLQTSTASTLSDSGDAQQVAANYENDVQAAAYITTQSASKPQCGSGTQLLALESDDNQTTGYFESIISYILVPVTSGSTTVYWLDRNVCSVSGLTAPTDTPLTPTSTTTVSYDLSSLQPAPTLSCVSGVPSSACAPTLANSQWVSAQDVTQVSFPITEQKSGFLYTLIAAPEASTSTGDTGSPLTANTTTSCSMATAGSGPYAGNLCFVDFSALTGNNLLAAEEGCLEMSVSLPQNQGTMYFCLGISGDPVAPAALPTYCGAYLGNSGTCGGSATGISPNYYGIPGEPALYQACEGHNVVLSGGNPVLVAGTNVDQCNTSTSYGPSATTTITVTNISVVSPNDLLATGWYFTSVDAESTDDNESIVWSTGAGGPNLTLFPNNPANPSSPVGNSCGNGVPVSGSTTLTCLGQGQAYHTGTPMVYALAPSSMTITMLGTGLEAITLGLFL